MTVLALLPAALAVALAATLTAGAVATVLYERRVRRRYPPTGRFMEVDGLRVHYVDAGPAGAEPLGTVVLLHGASSNLAESMLGLGSSLAGRYRVVALDRPGLGWTGRGSRADIATPARQAEILARVLRRLEVRDAVVVGHSWSGTLAPLFALDHPDIAGAILILAGVTHPWPGGNAAWYNRLVGSWAGRVLARTVAVPLSLCVCASVMARIFSPQAEPPGFTYKAQIPLALTPAAILSNLQDVGALHAAVTRQSARYGQIRVPAAVIAGDADRIVWTDLHSRAFAHDVPGARLVVLPGVGHMPQYARPEIVLAEIDALARAVMPSPAGAAASQRS